MTISLKQAQRAAAATAFGVVLAMALTSAGQAQPATDQIVKAETATPEKVARATLQSEIRIRRLHDKLKITAEQESLWQPVASVMRDNDIEFRNNLRSKTTELKTSTAVNDLQMFQVVADHHASGLKKFIPVFSTLYNGLPADQQKRADKIFAESSR